MTFITHSYYNGIVHSFFRAQPTKTLLINRLKNLNKNIFI
ncbi:Uncharacterised protein [Yersinia pseudotuberculosis]|nr:Uncharacterised protein [Yersinia pseudotuberculosis]CNI62053.1 Uncharacterised protein [Yersinia pseudotuberculosis]CNJ48791.1 Uncharacterised protein [Yersinia pseudotuberculosis]VEE69788.1 Uncharacterised protein [Yersinia pseudotuberculosis]